MPSFCHRRPLVIAVVGFLLAMTACAEGDDNAQKKASTEKPPATMRVGDADLPLVFQEDFEGDRSRFETTDDKAWELRKVEPDHGQVFALNRRKSDYQPPHRSPQNIAIIRDLELRDFAILFDVRNTIDTGAHRDCCVFFTHRSPAQFYYVHLGAKPDPASGQIMIVADAPRRPLTDNKNKIPWGNGWHRVKVTRQAASGAIAIYFDDMEKPVMEATDKTFEGGRLGIGSFDDMNEFDNIRVYGR